MFTSPKPDTHNSDTFSSVNCWNRASPGLTSKRAPNNYLPMDKNQKILEILRRVTKSGMSPTPEQSLFADGLIDSFALVDLVAELENSFAIKIPDSDLSPRKFDSIERIAAYVEERGA